MERAWATPSRWVLARGEGGGRRGFQPATMRLDGSRMSGNTGSTNSLIAVGAGGSGGGGAIATNEAKAKVASHAPQRSSWLEHGAPHWHIIPHLAVVESEPNIASF